jgi:hypothetical protein
MEEKAAIAAAHRGESESDDPTRLVPQLVRNPVALGDGGGIEQNGGDLGVGRALKPAIERPQREDEPAAPLGRERAGVGAWRAPGQRAPQAQCGGGTDVEELIKRQEHGDRGADLVLAVKPQARSAQLNDLIVVSDSEKRLEAARVEAKSRISEVVGEFRQGHYARKGLGYPENGAVSCGV